MDQRNERKMFISGSVDKTLTDQYEDTYVRRQLKALRTVRSSSSSDHDYLEGDFWLSNLG